jgi:hypothetical protein
LDAAAAAAEHLLALGYPPLFGRETLRGLRPATGSSPQRLNDLVRGD